MHEGRTTFLAKRNWAPMVEKLAVGVKKGHFELLEQAEKCDNAELAFATGTSSVLLPRNRSNKSVINRLGAGRRPLV